MHIHTHTYIGVKYLLVFCSHHLLAYVLVTWQSQSNNKTIDTYRKKARLTVKPRRVVFILNFD